MYQRTTTIQNPTGLHARPASEFVEAAGKFQADVFIRHAEDTAEDDMNAKSIIGVLALCAAKGDAVVLSAKGEDEKEAVDALVEMIEKGFGE